MIKKEKNGIVWFEFEIFQPFRDIQHGILTRHGGFSTSPFDSLCLNLTETNKSSNQRKNLNKVKETLNLRDIICAKQVHGTCVQTIDQDNRNCEFECDGFITQDKQTALLIKHADCQAALFYDPRQQAIASVHCGWRGNVQNIYAITVREMVNKYKCNPQDIYVGISPSLGPNFSEFKNYREEFPKDFWEHQVKPNYFDLWEIAKMQLIKSGIPKKNIELAKICTYETTSDFFSYRREKETGRNGSYIMLKNKP